MVGEIDITDHNVTTVTWHPILNQIFLGLSSKEIVTLYDPV